MKPNEMEFERTLMDEMGQLPPPPQEVEDYTPWQSAMVKILWGMALVTFQLQFFYLDYILPLVGTTLIYLGGRSMRRSGGWFRLCWAMSALKLLFHVAWTILSATPVAGLVVANPLWKWGLTWLVQGANLLLLFALWRGTRQAFFDAPRAGRPKRDWLGLGFWVHLLAMGVALWSELVPAAEPGLIGVTITNEGLYYGRPALFIVLEIVLFVCLARQREALVGRGYDLEPAPVHISGGRFVLAVFVLVLLALPPNLWLGSKVPTPAGTEVTGTLTAEQEIIRRQLVSLGMPEELLQWLDGAELEACAGATAVCTGEWYDGDATDDQEPQVEGNWLAVEAGEEQAELSTWMVFLPDQQVRYYHWFRYDEVPSLHLQEQFSIDPSGWYPTDHYSARLLWEKNGKTYVAAPEVQLAGGETAEELEGNLWAQMFPESAQMEIERLGGHLHYSPYFSFTIPDGAETLWGCLAYTVDAREMPEPADIHFEDPENWTYTDQCIVFLRHQVSWLSYPFVDIDDMGGQKSVTNYGPIRSGYGLFDFSEEIHG